MSFAYEFSLAEYVAKIRAKLPEDYRAELNELETILQIRDDDTEDFLNTNFYTATGSGAPTTTPSAGDQFYDATNDRLYVGNSANKWVCITPVSNGVATSQATASTSFTDLGTVGPSVTVKTGTKALVTVGCRSTNSLAGGINVMGFAVSGATTVAAADTSAYSNTGTDQVGAAAVIPVTGLTAGDNTFTAKYRATANTATFFDRFITVVGVP